MRDNLDGKRVFQDRMDIPGATQAACIDHCVGLNKGYDVAGIEYGVECYCSKSSEMLNYKLSEQCTFACPVRRPRALVFLVY